MNKKYARKQTSFYEQAIFYYVKKMFSDAQNRYLINNKIEIDIWIPSIKVAIEYDGYYWHKSEQDKDDNKNQYLNNLGIKVIRVRDSGLPQLPSFEGEVFYHRNIRSDVESFHIDEIIEQIIRYLSKITCNEEKQKQLYSFRLTHNSFLHDSPDINSALYNEQVKNSIAESYDIADWDYKKNKRLSPFNIGIKYPQKVFLSARRVSVNLLHQNVGIELSMITLLNIKTIVVI